LQLPSVSAFGVGKVAPDSVQRSRLALRLPESADPGPVLRGLPSFHSTHGRFDSTLRLPLLQFSLPYGFAPCLLCLSSTRGASFRFPCPLAPFEAADSIRRVPILRFVRISVSHRICELSCVISRSVPRLISSQKRLWAFPSRGFPSNDGQRALTHCIPSCCYGEGGHLICFRAA